MNVYILSHEEILWDKNWLIRQVRYKFTSNFILQITLPIKNQSVWVRLCSFDVLICCLPGWPRCTHCCSRFSVTHKRSWKIIIFFRVVNLRETKCVGSASSVYINTSVEHYFWYITIKIVYKNLTVFLYNILYLFLFIRME